MQSTCPLKIATMFAILQVSLVFDHKFLEGVKMSHFMCLLIVWKLFQVFSAIKAIFLGDNTGSNKGSITA